MLQTSVTASKRFRTESKSCILTQLSEATCVRNLLIVKILDHGKCKEWYHVKEERLLYRFLTFWKLCYVYFDHTKPCCKLLRQTSKIEKLQTTFRMVCCFRAYRFNTAEWTVKRIVLCKRWEQSLSVTYLCVLTLLLFETDCTVMYAGVTASWNFKLDPKSCILLQHFVVICFRKWNTVK